MSSPPRHPVSTCAVFGVWTILNFAAAATVSGFGLAYWLALANALIGVSVLWSIGEDLRRRAAVEDD